MLEQNDKNCEHLIEQNCEWEITSFIANEAISETQGKLLVLPICMTGNNKDT